MSRFQLIEYITFTCRHLHCHGKLLCRVNLCCRKFAVFTVRLILLGIYVNLTNSFISLSATSLNQSKGNSKFNVVYDIELLKKSVFFLYSKIAPEIQRNSKIHEKYKKSQTKNTMVHDCLPFFRNKKTIDFISWAKETGILCPNSPSIG